jgi:hypothetical protein
MAFSYGSLLQHMAAPLISSQPAESSQCGRRKKVKQSFMGMKINKQ